MSESGRNQEGRDDEPAVGCEPLAGSATYKRFHAWALSKRAARYERAVEPFFRELFGSLAGDVLEIGPGSGRTLRHYPRDIRWTGVEPNPFALPYLARQLEREGLAGTAVQGVGEKLPAEDASMDAVTSALVLCTVHDLEGVLREVRRVLKPEGRYVFIEHVAAPPGTWLRRLQRLIRTPWGFLADGCQPDRETWRSIESAGFSSVELRHVRVPAGLIAPHIVGTAIR